MASEEHNSLHLSEQLRLFSLGASPASNCDRRFTLGLRDQCESWSREFQQTKETELHRHALWFDTGTQEKESEEKHCQEEEKTAGWEANVCATRKCRPFFFFWF